MCGRFHGLPLNLVETIIKAAERGEVLNPMPDWPAVQQNVFPRRHASVIIENMGHLRARSLKWGYPMKDDVAFCTKVDTAIRPTNKWNDSLENRRCIIPALGFFETHKTEKTISQKTGKEICQQYLFTAPDSPLLYIAGIYEDDHFSMMTTEPNSWVQPIHDRMPLVILEEELGTWFLGNYTELFDRGNVGLKVEKQG